MTDQKFNPGRIIFSLDNPVAHDIVDRAIAVLYPEIKWDTIDIKSTATSVVNFIRQSLNDVFREVDQYVITPHINVNTKSITATISKSHIINNPDMQYFTHQAKVSLSRSLQQRIIDTMDDSNLKIKTTSLHSIVLEGIIQYIPSHLMNIIESVDRAIFTDSYGSYYVYKNRGTYSKTQVFINKEEFLEFVNGDRTVIVIPTTRLNL